jgi:hypothetical protein
MNNKVRNRFFTKRLLACIKTFKSYQKLYYIDMDWIRELNLHDIPEAGALVTLPNPLFVDPFTRDIYIEQPLRQECLEKLDEITRSLSAPILIADCIFRVERLPYKVLFKPIGKKDRKRATEFSDGGGFSL